MAIHFDNSFSDSSSIADVDDSISALFSNNYNKFDQVNLDLDFKKDFSEKVFFVDESNKNAFFSIKSDFQKLIIFGPKRSGKTHLSFLWKKKYLNTMIINPLELNDLELSDYQEYNAYIIENIDLIFPKFDSQNNSLNSSQINHYALLQKNFYNLYNYITLKSKSVLITAETNPLDWEFAFDDIKSRVLSIPAIKISLPSDELLKFIIKKLFVDLGVYVQDDVIDFIFQRISRSFEGAFNSVYFILDRSILEKRSISITFLRHISHLI
jgi:chromosomal replication initiation ATPase DnaA